MGKEMTGPTVALPGSLKNDKPFKLCSKCGDKKDPAGGIEMSPGKWRCVSCWRGFQAKRK